MEKILRSTNVYSYASKIKMPHQVVRVEKMAEHPYFPREVVIPNFVPGISSVNEILATFSVIITLILGGTWVVSKKWKHLSTPERLICCWWAATGFIHLVIEGSFASNKSLYSTPESKTNFLVEQWKEYAKADSRYATQDPFIVSMETVTAFIEGPLSFAALYSLARNKPYSDVLQLTVSLGQFYGDVLYFYTCYLEGFIHSDPGFLYFWFYFVFMNAIWIVVPFLIIVRSWRRIVTVFIKFDEVNKNKIA